MTPNKNKSSKIGTVGWAWLTVFIILVVANGQILYLIGIILAWCVLYGIISKVMEKKDSRQPVYVNNDINYNRNTPKLNSEKGNSRKMPKALKEKLANRQLRPSSLGMT